MSERARSTCKWLLKYTESALFSLHESILRLIHSGFLVAADRGFSLWWPFSLSFFYTLPPSLIKSTEKLQSFTYYNSNIHDLYFWNLQTSQTIFSQTGNQCWRTENLVNSTFCLTGPRLHKFGIASFQVPTSRRFPGITTDLQMTEIRSPGQIATPNYTLRPSEPCDKILLTIILSGVSCLQRRHWGSSLLFGPTWSFGAWVASMWNWTWLTAVQTEMMGKPVPTAVVAASHGPPGSDVSCFIFLL